MKGKKVCTILLAALLVAVMCSACTVADPSSAAPAPAPSAASTAPASAGGGDGYTIGISWQGATNDWASAVQYHFEYALDHLYADKVKEYHMTACDMDDKKQISDIEDLLTKDLDLLIVQPVSEVSLANSIENAKASGIPVVIYGGACGTDSYDYYVNRDNYQTGRMYADWMGRRLEGKGNVIVIVGFPGSGYSNDVLMGVEDGLADYPDINVLGTEYAQYTPALSKQIIESYLIKGEQIDGVLVDGGLMNFGVMEAFTDAQLPIPPTTGDDGFGFLRKAKELGYEDFYALSSGNELALDAVTGAIDILEGKEVTVVDLRPPKGHEGAEILGLLDDTLPDSYWLSCQIPADVVHEYYPAP